jgi:hypothetical protein
MVSPMKISRRVLPPRQRTDQRSLILCICSTIGGHVPSRRSLSLSAPRRDETKATQTLPKKTWRDATTVADVLARLDKPLRLNLNRSKVTSRTRRPISGNTERDSRGRMPENSIHRSPPSSGRIELARAELVLCPQNKSRRRACSSKVLLPVIRAATR